MEKIQTEHGIFTSNEKTGQTAEEVYQYWLENKDKTTLPTMQELQIEYNIGLDYRLSLIEMGLI